jgi:hypothetical protein
MLARQSFLDTQILREAEFYELNTSIVEPTSLGEYVYYRNPFNPADALTLYRFPVVELQRHGFTEGQSPFLREPEDSDDEEAMEDYVARKAEWPEEIVFHFGDLVEFYRDFALKDERIKEFVEKMKEYLEQMSHMPLHYF